MAATNPDGDGSSRPDGCHPQPVVARVSLQSLPWEILINILVDLEYGSVLFLSVASTTFRSSLDPSLVVGEKARNEFFLKAEHFNQHRDNLACFSCLRMRPIDDFGNSMRKGKRGKNSRDEDSKMTRFCWTCAAEKCLYPQGAPVRKGKYKYFPCHRCGKIQLEGDSCTAEQCAEPIVAPKSRLESLPDHVQRRIFGMLGYVDAIRLAQTNRYLKAVVNPQACDLRTKFMFMQRIERREMGRVGGRWYVGCYSCFTYKHRTKFSQKQINLTNLHQPYSRQGPARFARRCQACLYQLYNPARREESTVERARFHSQVLCDGCKELRYEDQADVCVGCEGIAAMRAEQERLSELVRQQRKLRHERPEDSFLETDILLALEYMGIFEADNELGPKREEEDGHESRVKAFHIESEKPTAGQFSSNRESNTPKNGLGRPVRNAPKRLKRHMREIFGLRLPKMFSVASWRSKRHE